MMTKAGKEILKGASEALAMTKLKNCPFCGGEAKLENNGIFARVICLKCRIWQDDYDPERVDEAINDWNRRADDWQPIETAPKEALVSVLLYGRAVSNQRKDEPLPPLHVAIGSRSLEFKDGTTKTGKWYTNGYSFTPTHWKPLPPPTNGDRR